MEALNPIVVTEPSTLYPFFRVQAVLKVIGSSFKGIPIKSFLLKGLLKRGSFYKRESFYGEAVLWYPL